MQEKNELSDIMLNKSGENATKTKKILLLSVGLIIVFLVVLAVMKLINKPEQKKYDLNIAIPPEPTTKMGEKQNKEELFKQVPIIEENSSDKKVKKDNFNAMVEKLKQKEQKGGNAKTNIVNTSKKIAKKTKKISSKSKYKRKAVKPKHMQKGIYYVQVGVTFKEKPDGDFLTKIKKAGYAYTLYSLKISGKKATKILIGPYKNRKEAMKNISKIKKTINKAAFVYIKK